MRNLVAIILIILVISGFKVGLAQHSINSISSIALSPDSQYLAVSYYDNTFEVINLSTNQIAFTEVIAERISVIRWSPSGIKIAIILFNGAVIVKNVSTWQNIFTLPPHPEGPGLSWNPSETLIYANYGGTDTPRILIAWDSNTGVKVNEYPSIGHVVWSPQNNFVASIRVDTIFIHDVNTFGVLTELTLPNDFENKYQVSALTWANDGIHMAVGYINNKIRIWNVQTSSIVVEFNGGNDITDTIRLLSYNITNSRLSALSQSGLQMSWDTVTWQTIQGQFISPNITRASFNSTGSELVYVLSGIDLEFYDLCDVVIAENSISEAINSIITGNQLGYINICLTENATYTLTTSLPDITGDITLIGNGAQIVMTGGSRIFNVTATGSLHLKNVTLSGGVADDGGAIFNAGDLTLENVTLQNHSAVRGGAIYNIGNLVMNGGAIQNNTASEFGGGIYNLGDMQLDGMNIRARG